MVLKVKFFGDLKKKFPDIQVRTVSPIRKELDSNEINRVSDIAKKFDIKEEEVGHIFVNNSYSKFTREVHDGDRISLFPRKNMSLLYKWYFTKK
jgi:molybdopterin converting factor small subunit